MTDNINQVLPDLIYSDMDQRAGAYGYTNLGTKQVTLEFFKEQKHEEVNESNPKKQLNVMTYNIWMSENIKYSRYPDRAPHIIEIIKNANADVIFLQETSKRFLAMLKADKAIMTNYYFSVSDSEVAIKNTSVFTLILSKEPICFSAFGLLTGEHKYSFTFAQISKFFLVNVYLHAGSKYSPGIINYQKYHEYRSIQLKIIQQQISKCNKLNLPIILGGDFNFHLDGNQIDFPEGSIVKEFGLKDSWREINPDSNGWTEDTNTNFMRWNVKQQEKYFRYDGIFVPSHVSVNKATLLGTNSIFAIDFNEEMSRELYASHMTRAQLDPNKMRLVDGKFPFWPSDHYGVIVGMSL
jgi:exonuclease III